MSELTSILRRILTSTVDKQRSDVANLAKLNTNICRNCVHFELLFRSENITPTQR